MEISTFVLKKFSTLPWFFRSVFVGRFCFCLVLVRFVLASLFVANRRCVLLSFLAPPFLFLSTKPFLPSVVGLLDIGFLGWCFPYFLFSIAFDLLFGSFCFLERFVFRRYPLYLGYLNIQKRGNIWISTFFLWVFLFFVGFSFL